MNIFQDVNNWLSAANQLRVPSKENFKLCKDLILEELEELEQAFIDKDAAGQRDAIVDLIWVALNWDYYANLNSESHAKSVLASNLSKFCTTKEEAEQTVHAYITGTHPSKPGQKIECYIDESDDYFIVKRLSDNKVLKSINFVEP